MIIRFHCTNCGKRLKADEARAGRTSVCPRCSTTVVIPSASDSQLTMPAEVEAGDAANRDNDESGTKPASEHALLLVKPVARHNEDLIDMTAMVDIVFFLLIYFMVMSIQDIASVIGLPKPQAQASSAVSVADFANDPNYLTVTIYEDDSVWVEDEQAFGPQDLRARLRAAKKNDSLLTGMLVVASPEASHGNFVMVIDAGADAGLTELMFSVPETLDPIATGG
jgi:biopolymer transport protein ExbD/DNA-directed RNA polymerase subunit RPC12/RpoP